MLEQKLIVGRYIDLGIANKPPPAGVAGSFALMPVQDCYLQESTGVFTKTSSIVAQRGAKARRNFIWLPWVSGRISEVALMNTDVLTGPMSGCWLVTYRKANGVRHAGHLGTDVANPAGTAAVNNTWNNFATGFPGQVIGGFNPFRHWNGNMPVAHAGEAAIPRFFGLFTTTNQYYVMATFQQMAQTTKLRIAGIQLVASSPLARLQTVHLPGP